jgi:hypothetical protein
LLLLLFGAFSSDSGRGRGRGRGRRYDDYDDY